jgi:hypothetical protein
MWLAWGISTSLAPGIRSAINLAFAGGMSLSVAAVDYECGRADLGDAAVGFPAKDALQLAPISQRSGIPLHANGHVFIDAFPLGAGRDIAFANAAIVESDGAIALAEDGAAAMPHVGGITETHDEQEGLASSLVAPIDLASLIFDERQGVSHSAPSRKDGKGRKPILR